MSIQNVKESFFKHVKGIASTHLSALTVLYNKWQGESLPALSVFFGEKHWRRHPFKALTVQLTLRYGDYNEINATNALQILEEQLYISEKTLNETRECNYYEYDTGSEVVTSKTLQWIQVGSTMPVYSKHDEIEGYTILLDVLYR
jgi:hypothetical protein